MSNIYSNNNINRPRSLPKALDTDGNLGSFIPAAFTWLWTWVPGQTELFELFISSQRMNHEEESSWAQYCTSSILLQQKKVYGKLKYPLFIFWFPMTQPAKQNNHCTKEMGVCSSCKGAISLLICLTCQETRTDPAHNYSCSLWKRYPEVIQATQPHDRTTYRWFTSLKQ